MRIGRFFPSPVRRAVKKLVPKQQRFALYAQLQSCYWFLDDWWFHARHGALGERLIIVVGSSHRVGSTWLYYMLRDLAHCQLGIDHIPSQFRFFEAIILNEEAHEYLCRLKGHKIFKSHSLPPASAKLDDCVKFVSIYRDPRDVLVSQAFYVAHLPHEQGGLGKEFRETLVSERILQLIKGKGTDLLLELETWFSTPLAYKMRYEALKKQPVAELWKVAKFIDLPIIKEATQKIVHKHAFQAKSGRQPGQEKREHPMRKGIIGDWRNYFDQACITAFKTEREGRWNRLLIEMGYESSPDWN